LNYLSQLLIVGAGGFIGSAMRFVVSSSVQRLVAPSLMPYGTLAVNVLGCLAIGILGGLAESRFALEPAQRLFLMAGILGGFTTFSAFALESLALFDDGAFMKAVFNVVAQLILGFGAAIAGYAMTRTL
jgi:CrcB protein